MNFSELYQSNLTLVPLPGLDGGVDVWVVVLEDGDGARDAHAAVLQLVLVKVRTQQLLVRVHPDRDYFVDGLNRGQNLQIANPG